MSLHLEVGQPPIHGPIADAAGRRPFTAGARRHVALWWPALTWWTILWAAVSAYHGLYSWHYFRTAGLALLDPSAQGGLHVFAAHPELQMGPLTLLVSAVVVAVAGTSASGWVGAVLMLALGMVDLWLLWQAGAARAARPDDRVGSADGPRGRSVAVAGALMLPVWSVLAVHYGHLDDVLAMSLVCAGLLQATRGRSWPALVLLALATAAKPWALPMMLIAWGEREGRLRRALVGMAAVALPWLAFVIADPGTLTVGSFTIRTEVDSVLRVLGVTTPTTPSWDRPVQLLLGVLIAWLCARCGRIGWIPLAVLAVRLVLDPGTYLYYTSSLALAAVAADLVGRRGARVPWLTIGVTAWFVVDLFLKLQLRFTLAGEYRSAFLLALLGVVAAIPLRAATYSEGYGRRHRCR
ncbi:hypothetical protein [Raineyella sp. W15-4]|uniref:hypothetical protein n=1 Tax=Raineyella sp. W15-4 TaxID=3081651 RepID=UPI002953964D|nr:hypothetical protein [Raineyella sp. W15-4]WOQ17232.1 hypothetical protein R0145_00540 [Raineyella sp. W15-4]